MQQMNDVLLRIGGKRNTIIRINVSTLLHIFPMIQKHVYGINDMDMPLKILGEIFTKHGEKKLDIVMQFVKVL